jgi:hypothetical protein
MRAEHTTKHVILDSHSDCRNYKKQNRFADSSTNERFFKPACASSYDWTKFGKGVPYVDSNTKFALAAGVADNHLAATGIYYLSEKQRTLTAKIVLGQ